MPEKVTMFHRRTAVGVGGVVGAVVLLVGLVTPASAATGTTALYGPGVTNYVDAGVQGLSCHDFGADNDFYTNINNAANGGIYIYRNCSAGSWFGLPGVPVGELTEDVEAVLAVLGGGVQVAAEPAERLRPGLCA